MKLSLAAFLMLFSFFGFSQELPKACFGKYGGEMPSYTILYEGSGLTIAKHDVYIEITENEIFYTGGDLALNGAYTFFKQSKNEYVIKAALSNGKSLKYEISLMWNKKKETLVLMPKNGQAEAVLERLDD